tara:strand:+ start:504 stop:1178 length:675 start_codon:yes stop_codon:yes gene_type:complete
MDFLPQVKMDFIPSDEEIEEDEVEEVTEEEEQDIIEVGEDHEDEETIEDKVPVAKSKREDMNIDDIFNMPIKKEIKLTKKGVPRKQRPPMTEAHKEKLKFAREKAMASRKSKAKERKESKALDIEEKELLKKQKVKRVKKLKEEVDDEIVYDNNKNISHKKSFTKEDLEDAQLNAIVNYEKIRKERKKEKQEKLKQNADQEQLKQTIRRAVAPPQEYNPFDSCY